MASNLKSSTLKSFEVYSTATNSVSAQLIEINGVPHVGLHRTYTPPKAEFEFSNPKPISKGVFLPLAAWDKFVNVTVPALQKEIKSRQQPKVQPPKAQPLKRKATSSAGMCF